MLSEVKTVSVEDAKKHLFQILSEVEEGMTFILTREGKPVAQIVPFPTGA